jgi:phosphotransferase system IIB component
MLEILMNFNEFNSKYWWIYLAIVIVILLSFLIILISKKISKEKKKAKIRQNSNLNNIYSYLGGRENVVSHDLIGTRLTLVLKDYQKVNREKLKEIGVERVLSMSNKYILVGEAKDLEKINKNLEQK